MALFVYRAIVNGDDDPAIIFNRNLYADKTERVVIRSTHFLAGTGTFQCLSELGVRHDNGANISSFARVQSRRFRFLGYGMDGTHAVHHSSGGGYYRNEFP